MTEYVHVGSHADVLASGRVVGPGERLTHDDLDAEDQHVVEEGRLVNVESFEKGASNEVLSLEEAKSRAAELNIEGRSKMSADQLRTAIAEHENPEAPDAA